MKFGAVYCLYDDHEYLEVSFESVKEQLDKVLFLMSDVPWNGRPKDNTATIEKVKELCRKNKNCEFVQGHWTNEIDQRNYGLQLFYSAGIDYYFVIDSDEVYHVSHFEKIKLFILQNPHIAAFHIEWNTYWTKQYYVISPREYYKPVIAVKVSSFLFTTIRHGITSVTRVGNVVLKSGGTDYNYAIIPSSLAICFHLSYARTDEYMKRKLETNSHAPEFLNGWYDNVWCKWKPGMKNLHPVTPKQYDQAVPEDFVIFPASLKTFIKKEKARKCSIIILNWDSYDLLIRCIELIQKNTLRQYEIIVVDNGSKDLPEGFKLKLLTYGISKVLINAENKGFAGGVNHGIKLADPDSDICLMNVDAEPQQGWLEALYATLLNNPSAGIIGPLGNKIYSGYQREGMFEKDTPLVNVHFYCALIFREVINKIGILDTRYGLGGMEDNDYCIRANMAGYASWVSAKSLVTHEAHQTMKRHDVMPNEKGEEEKFKIMAMKLIQTLYDYNDLCNLYKLAPQLAEKCGLIIR